MTDQTVRGIQVVAGVVLLAGQLVLQVIGVSPNYLMVGAALALVFGLPFLAGIEVRRRNGGGNG